MVGTSIFVSSIGISRGLEGNPTSANPMPTPNVGPVVESTMVTTGALRDPGFNPAVSTPPTFSVNPEVREFVKMALQGAQASLSNHLAELWSLLNGKSLNEEMAENARARPPSPPSPPTPPLPPSQLNNDELMSMLYSNLLAQAEATGQPEDEITGLLCRNLKILTITRLEFDCFKAEVYKELSDMKIHISDTQESVLGAINSLREETRQSCRPHTSFSRRPRVSGYWKQERQLLRQLPRRHRYNIMSAHHLLPHIIWKSQIISSTNAIKSKTRRTIIMNECQMSYISLECMWITRRNFE